jgi:hypothetical protein
MYGDVMRTRKQVQMEEDRLVELAERIRLIHEYPTKASFIYYIIKIYYV